VQTVIGGNGLPQPPIDAIFNLSIANTFTSIYAVGVALFVVLMIWRSRNASMVLAMILGGALTTLNEPVFDILTVVWHPIVNQNVAFTWLGRDIPVWAILGYTAYYGCMGYLTTQALIKGVTMHSIWAWCLVPIGFDFLIEETMLHWDLYYYFANQPLVLIKFPLYQPACNTVGVFFAATLLFLLNPYLKQGWKWFPAAMVILPFGGAMGFIGAALPCVYAANTPSLPNWITQLCGVATYALMFAWVYGVSLIVATDSPYRYNTANRRVKPDIVAA
jgi:hypothetical protein